MKKVFEVSVGTALFVLVGPVVMAAALQRCALANPHPPLLGDQPADVAARVTHVEAGDDAGPARQVSQLGNVKGAVPPLNPIPDGGRFMWTYDPPPADSGCPGGCVGTFSQPGTKVLVDVGSWGAYGPTGSAGNVSGDATYELWEMTQTTTWDDPVLLLSGGVNLVGRWLMFALYCYPGVLGVQPSNWSLDVWSTPCNDGNWHHVAVTRQDVGGGSFYWGLWFDGANIGDKTGSTQVTDAADRFITVGGMSAGSPNPTQVLITQVRVSNVVRYTSAFAPQTTFTADGDTVALWQMPETCGAVTQYDDSSGNGYSLTYSDNLTSWQMGTCQ